MSYLGNNLSNQNFTPQVDYFSGNGSNTSFTLSRTVGSVAQVQVFVENVPQNPSSAFYVYGNTLTFTGAPPSGTNNIYVSYTSPVTQYIRPSQGSVSNTEIDSRFSLWNLNSANVSYSAGNVGIGTTTPGQKLSVNGSIESLVDNQGGVSEGGQVILRAPTGGTKRWNLDNYNNTLRLFHENDSDASSGAVALTLTANGVLCLAGASLTATGTGIVFPGSQNASSDANCLDDYEEGTWTPQFETGSTQPGNLTYVNRGGNYTKIGRQVIAWFYMNITVTSAGSGNPAVIPSSLPFTPRSDNLTNSASTRGGFATSVPNTGAYGAVMTWNNANPSLADALYITNATCGGSMTTGAASGVYAGYVIYETT